MTLLWRFILSLQSRLAPRIRLILVMYLLVQLLILLEISVCDVLYIVFDLTMPTLFFTVTVIFIIIYRVVIINDRSDEYISLIAVEVEAFILR